MELGLRSLAERLESRLRKRPVEKMWGAAQDHLREVEGSDDWGEGDTEVLARLRQNLVLRGIVDRHCELRFKPRRGEPSLEAAELAAGAFGSAVGTHHHVADLT